MLRLKETPDLTKERSWESAAEGDRSMDFVIWQAEEDGRPVRLRISASELAEFTGGTLPITEREAQIALNRSRRAIEHCASEKRQRGETVITIDAGDLAVMLPIWRQ